MQRDAMLRQLGYTPNEAYLLCKGWKSGYGQNKSKGKVKDGKINDKWTYWFENGQILKEENYKEGKKNGK